MCTDTSTIKRKGRLAIPAGLSQLGCILLAASFACASPLPKDKADELPRLQVQLNATSSDVLKAVQEVTQDQIIHGTYTYDKERILYGAHSADSARVFGTWNGPGRAFYKVADNVLAPRFFKDSGDIGTITVRYIVREPDEAKGPILQIDAIFVDARNVRHPSLGSVEQGEYAAIQEHLKNVQAHRGEEERDIAAVAARRAQADAAKQQPAAGQILPAAKSVAPTTSVPEMQARIDALRHQVELRVRDQGAQLKTAPFHSAATIQSLPAETEVLIVIVSSYWYGVQTIDGHRGWIHRSQLEPLP
jgi:hypothetical protein